MEINMNKPKRNYKLSKIDECQSPRYAVEPILSLLKTLHIKFIWECAAGDGNLARALLDSGFEVTSTDIKTGMDFLDCDFDPHVDAIVTNPPFSLKHLFVEKCMELRKPWFLLMPVEAIATWRVQKVLDYTTPGLIKMIIPTKRINFKMPNKAWSGNGAQFPTAWYCWDMFIDGIEIFDASHWTKEYRQKLET